MKIACLGAVLMDQIGKVESFPGVDEETFVTGMEMKHGGSAANTAVFLSRMGIPTGFFGKVGNDDIGGALVRELDREGVETKGLVKADDLLSGTAYIAVNPKGERIIYAYSGAANELNEDDIDLEYLNSFDVLHLSCLENLEIMRYCAKAFKGKVSLSLGALGVVKKDALELVKEADILFFSRSEILAVSKERDIEKAIGKIAEYGAELIFVTLGSEGALVYNRKNKKILKKRAVDAEVVDTTGAGDAFSAGALYAVLKGKSAEEALSYGNACAALNVSKAGARGGFKELSEVEKLIK